MIGGSSISHFVFPAVSSNLHHTFLCFRSMQYCLTIADTQLFTRKYFRYSFFYSSFANNTRLFVPLFILIHQIALVSKVNLFHLSAIEDIVEYRNNKQCHKRCIQQPPIVTIAIPRDICALVSVLNTIVDIARTVVSAVIKIGRIRVTRFPPMRLFWIRHPDEAG